MTAAYSISYPSGYPCYPTYAHQLDRLAFLESGESKEIRYCRSANGHSPLEVIDTFKSDERTEVFTFSKTDVRFVVLVSDGVHSFSSTQYSESSKSTVPIPFQCLARELVSFKNVRGSFASRRLKSFLKHCSANNWQHSDDLSIGGIYLGD